MGRVDANDLIEFHGRIDRQCKIRGYRVELAEIESVLSTCKGVKMAIVDYRNKTLMAWIVKLENNHQSEKELLKNIQSHARKILAEYMVPSLYFFETNIPYLPNG